MFKYQTRDDLTDLEGIGLIFVSTDDPLHSIFQSLSKYPLPLIGIWYTTHFEGKKINEVIFMDPYLGLMKSSFLKDKLTIEKLLNNPSVLKIAIRKINTENFKIISDYSNHSEDSCERSEDSSQEISDDDEVNERNIIIEFRLALAKIISLYKPADKMSTVKHIFSYNITSDTPDNNYYINEILTELNIYNPNYEKINQSEIFLLGQIIKELKLGYNIDNLLASNIKMINDLCHYLINPKYFEPLIFFNIEDVSDELKAATKRRAIKTYAPYLSDICSIMFDMMSNDEQFFTIVIRGLMKGQLVDINRNEFISKLIDELNINIQNMFNCLKEQSLYKFSDIDQFRSLFNKYLQLNNESCDITGQDIISDDFSLEPGLIMLTETDEYPTLINNFTSLHHEIKEISRTIRTGEQTIINLNKIIDNLNYISEKIDPSYASIDRINKDGSYGAIIIINENTKNQIVKISLINRKRIKLSCYNPDLSDFDEAILTEILQTLDRLADGSQGIDNLRSVICLKLAEFQQKIDVVNLKIPEKGNPI